MRALAIASLLIGTAAAGATAQRHFMPLREIYRQAFLDVDGTANPRYQFRYVADHDDPNTCLLVLTDETTGQFAITAVPGSACAVRGSR